MGANASSMGGSRGRARSTLLRAAKSGKMGVAYNWTEFFHIEEDFGVSETEAMEIWSAATPSPVTQIRGPTTSLLFETFASALVDKIFTENAESVALVRVQLGHSKKSRAIWDKLLRLTRRQFLCEIGSVQSMAFFLRGAKFSQDCLRRRNFVHAATRGGCFVPKGGVKWGAFGEGLELSWKQRALLRRARKEQRAQEEAASSEPSTTTPTHDDTETAFDVLSRRGREEAGRTRRRTVGHVQTTAPQQEVRLPDLKFGEVSQSSVDSAKVPQSSVDPGQVPQNSDLAFDAEFGATFALPGESDPLERSHPGLTLHQWRLKDIGDGQLATACARCGVLEESPASVVACTALSGRVGLSERVVARSVQGTTEARRRQIRSWSLA